MTEEAAGGTERGTERVEAFSDGVFAIAITLLILEVKVPHGEAGHGPEDLLGALLHLWPAYFAYVLSFVMIGIYWANHHYIFKLYRRTDHTLNLLNLLLLLAIAFLPFPTAVLGDHLLDPANRTTAAAFYAFGLLLPAIPWAAAWFYGSRSKLIDERLAPRFLRRLNLQFGLTVALYTLAVVLCLAEVRLGLGLCVGLTLLYLLPPPRPVYLGSEETRATPASSRAGGSPTASPVP